VPQQQHPPTPRSKPAATTPNPAPPPNVNGRKTTPKQVVQSPPAPIEAEFDDEADEEYEEEEEYEEDDEEEEDEDEEEGEGEEEEEVKQQRGRQTVPQTNNTRAARRPAAPVNSPKVNGREGLFNLGSSLTVTGKWLSDHVCTVYNANMLVSRTRKHPHRR
jgi:hypothetical protein